MVLKQLWIFCAKTMPKLDVMFFPWQAPASWLVVGPAVDNTLDAAKNESSGNNLVAFGVSCFGCNIELNMVFHLWGPRPAWPQEINNMLSERWRWLGVLEATWGSPVGHPSSIQTTPAWCGFLVAVAWGGHAHGCSL